MLSAVSKVGVVRGSHSLEEPDLLDEPVPGRQLLIATTGGHLAQLVKLSSTIGADEDSLWITFQTPQSESLLANRRTLYVPYVGSRDIRGAVRGFVQITNGVNWCTEIFSSAVSTGAAVGIVGLVAARLHGVPGFYFESISRVNGPTLSGKIASIVPGIQTYCQHIGWANRRWKYRPGSLLDSYSKAPGTPKCRPRLFVTLGTNRSYRFDALVDAVLETGLADDQTVWQLGMTTRVGLPGAVFEDLSSAEFEHYARDADVVVTHAGVGTLLNLLEMGIYPVVVPRRAKRREVVDDHQLQIARLLDSRGLALVAEVEQLEPRTLVDASGFRIEPVTPRNG